MRKKYIFPLNFDYSSKFLGIFEYRILLPFCIFGFVLAFLLSRLNLSTVAAINSFILIFLPLFLLANTTIFKEPLIKFLICIIKHYLTAGKYHADIWSTRKWWLKLSHHLILHSSSHLSPVHNGVRSFCYQI